MSSIAFEWRTCPACHQTFLFEVRLERGYSDYEQIACPECAQPLGEIRADLGYTVVGKAAIACGDGSSEGMIPDPLYSLVADRHQWVREEDTWIVVTPKPKPRQLPPELSDLFD